MLAKLQKESLIKTIKAHKELRDLYDPDTEKVQYTYHDIRVTELTAKLEAM